ncbi:MAG: S1 RNA-binding domain-containing protein [bacterium]|nr:S1 RNA-binding domain-containing protein [bacterium]
MTTELKQSLTNDKNSAVAVKVDNSDFEKLITDFKVNPPKVGDIVKGTVISASKSAVKLDVDGIMVGIVRGRELYREAPEYASLKVGDEVEATVIDVENENGELELSFSYAGHQKAWETLNNSFEKGEVISVKIKEANKGGLIVSYGQIVGFLPVSQLSPENYPRVSGGDKAKILEKLRSFINKDIDVKIMDLSEKEDKLIVSEKMSWSEKQKDVIAEYKPGSVVEGTITAITSFGAFISFGQNLEGLIHISELAWQRIENPADIVKIGDKIKAEIINIDGAKIFLSAKKLIKDPWQDVKKKYKLNDKVSGLVLKINPFGLFVKLDNDIHALAHISTLPKSEGQSLADSFKVGQSYDFFVISMEPDKHRLGLSTKPLEAKEPVKAEKKDTEEKNIDDQKTAESKKEAKTKKVKVKNTEKAEEEKEEEVEKKNNQ